MRIADDLTTSTSRLGAQATPRRDLDDRAQVHDLVVGFYRELVFDDVLAPVFEEVAEVDWAVHIPKLIDFWCRVLLDQPGYDGFLLGAHREVHDRQPFEAHHFERWYALWVETIEERWEGPIAEAAKRHAAKVDLLVAALARGEHDLAVGFCDLDDFKQVNDRLGHSQGDTVLVEIVHRLLRGCAPATRSRGWAVTSWRSSGATCRTTPPTVGSMAISPSCQPRRRHTGQMHRSSLRQQRHARNRTGSTRPPTLRELDRRAP